MYYMFFYNSYLILIKFGETDKPLSMGRWAESYQGHPAETFSAPALLLSPVLTLGSNHASFTRPGGVLPAPAGTGKGSGEPREGENGAGNEADRTAGRNRGHPDTEGGRAGGGRERPLPGGKLGSWELGAAIPLPLTTSFSTLRSAAAGGLPEETYLPILLLSEKG